MLDREPGGQCTQKIRLEIQIGLHFRRGLEIPFLYFFPPVYQIAHSSLFSDHRPGQDWALGVDWQPSGRQPSGWQAAACPGTSWLRVFLELVILWGSKLKGGPSFV